MKRKLKCISLNYVLPSDRTLDILEIGPLYNKHTQLNVCEKEELPCFLYLIQIFGYIPICIMYNLIQNSIREADGSTILLEFRKKSELISKTQIAALFFLNSERILNKFQSLHYF